jgi:phage terminase large subunit-like protein
MMQIAEDETYHFDLDAAEKPIRFIEKYCRHFEGKWAGTNLLLQDWQKKIITDLYGWKHKATGKRRFTELFLLSAKGAGKTPFLSAIGQYELFAGGEHAAHVVSMAANYKQAYLTMEWAKKSIVQDAKLDAKADITEHVIRYPKKNSKWTTLSGTFSGNAGFRPSCVLADEAWEWPNSKLYDSVTANLFKREQPLLLVATNAGESQNTFCWKLCEQARAVLAGRSARRDLLPVIFEAPLSLNWTSEDAARAACPSIPDVVSFDSLRPKIVAAKESPAGEAEYRRLHLSQWVHGGANKWLDIGQWDACTLPIDPEKIKAADLYIGYDGSERDDLCAATFVWVTTERFYVDSHFWLPRATAEHYEKKNAIPYKAWSAAGHITLLDEPTISDAVQARIAAEIVARAKPFKVKAVCFDHNLCGYTIAALENAGLTCVDVRQGFTLTPGCEALARRIQEKSITFSPNGVLRFCAENVEVTTTDRHGNYWPAKPMAKGQYAGRKSQKIDGISSLVTALTEARKHSFPTNQKKWTGGVWIV